MFVELEAPFDTRWDKNTYPSVQWCFLIFLRKGDLRLHKAVRRYIGEKPSQYVVVALMMMKTEVDSFSGSVSHELIYRSGDINQPVDFLPFFEQVERERQSQIK